MNSNAHHHQMVDPNTGSNIGSRRMVFMTEKEKKEELIMKQRAELAIKKGTAELDLEIEKEIAMEVLEALESELTKLLSDNDDGSMIDSMIRTNLPISRKSIQDNILVNNIQYGGSTLEMIGIDNDTSSKFSSSATDRKQSTSNSNSSSRGSILKQSSIGSNNSEVNIEDIFDFDKFDSWNNEGNDMNNNPNNHHTSTINEEAINITTSNEFAAELLYIMKTSISLS
jgi:hypothetical protein